MKYKVKFKLILATSYFNWEIKAFKNLTNFHDFRFGSRQLSNSKLKLRNWMKVFLIKQMAFIFNVFFCFQKNVVKLINSKITTDCSKFTPVDYKIQAYCSNIWSSAPKYYLQLLETIQKRDVKLIIIHLQSVCNHLNTEKGWGQ